MDIELEHGEKFAMDTLSEQTLWQEKFHEIVESLTEQTSGDEARAPGQQRRYVGSRLPRNDVLYKVRGKAMYSGNIHMPGMIHGEFVRSEQPHALIKSIDVSQALKVPGVHCILTAEDIEPDRLLVGTHDFDTPVFAKDRVRYVGEPIAAIAADTAEAAALACRLVEVEYEALPCVFSPEEALAPGAPQVDPEGPVIVAHNHQVGDAETAIKGADIVVEGTFVTEPIDHCFMEAQCGVAFVDSDGVLTLVISTQYPHFHNKQLAHVTGLPVEKIRVIAGVVGGAFGGKIDNTVECALALFALKTGRPVKMALSRAEVFIATTKRHRTQIRQRLAADRNGRFVALEIDMLCDGGAYRSYSRVVAGRCMIHSGVPYRFPNLSVKLTTAFTNHVPSGSMRSFGVVKMAFALESAINEIARRLNMSPIEIRRINGFREGDAISTGQVLQDVNLDLTLDAIEPIYERVRAEIDADQPGPVKRGLGIACLGYGIGYSGIRNPSTARIKLSRQGDLTILTGTPDIGSGSDSALAQIAADAIGVDLHRIRVVSGDSTLTDDSGPTSASRTTYFSGNAIYLAATDFKRKFSQAVAAELGVPADQARFDDDCLIMQNRTLSFTEAAETLGEKAEEIMGFGKFDPDINVDISTLRGNAYPTYTYATHLMEIELDEDLGQVTARRCWTAQDGGTIVNPVGAEGQIHGGVVQGLGMALWEKVIREKGVIVNPNYRDYLLAGAKDAPLENHAIFVDTNDRTGPFGAKGVAEAAIIPVPGAIASAIADAVGVIPYRLPMDAEYIRSLISKNKSDEAKRIETAG